LTITIGEWLKQNPEALRQPDPLPAEPPSWEPSRWFALTVEPLREAYAAGHLIGRRIACYLPAVAVWCRRGRAMQWRTEPMFRGYVFIRVGQASAADEVGRARHLPGVTGVVPAADTDEALAAIRETDIARMRTEEALSFRRKREAMPYEGRLNPGDPVTIAEGAFADFGGHIAELIDAERAKVLVVIFGRATPVILPVWMLEAG